MAVAGIRLIEEQQISGQQDSRHISRYYGLVGPNYAKRFDICETIWHFSEYRQLKIAIPLRFCWAASREVKNMSRKHSGHWKIFVST